MPIPYQIDHARRLVIATPSGAFTEQDILAYQTEVWSRPEVAGYDEIVDMTNVTEMKIVATEGVQMLAVLSARMDTDEARSRFAIVAPTDHHFGVGRMYEAYRNTQPAGTKAVGVFRSREEALRWLGK